MMTPAAWEGRGGFLFAMQSQSKRRNIINNLNDTAMREFIEILTSENKSFEGLPKWVYMVVAPALLVLMCMIGGTLS
jgi:hypothetical protein